MSKNNDGGPAFPVHGGYLSKGISVRDHFAATAKLIDSPTNEYAQALVGRPIPLWKNDPVGNAEFWAEFEAKVRYIKADAMIKVREQ